MKRIYLDSNVFISLVKDEIGRDFTLLSEDSRIFVDICSKMGFVLVLSSWFIKEVERVISLTKEDIVETMQERGVVFEFVKPMENVSKEAKRIARSYNLHYNDAIHVAIAKEYECDFIVSWNKKDFEKVENIIKCKTPKEIISEVT